MQVVIVRRLQLLRLTQHVPLTRLIVAAAVVIVVALMSLNQILLILVVSLAGRGRARARVRVRVVRLLRVVVFSNLRSLVRQLLCA